MSRGPYRDVGADFATMCDLDLALTYALRRPRLAIAILRDTYARIGTTRPDLAHRVRELASIIGL